MNVVEQRSEAQGQYHNVLHKFDVSLPRFSGPFDVLLHLIEEEKLSVCDVSLSDITSAYLTFLWEKSFDMDLSGEFLVMASYLVEMKSKALLPAPPQVEDEEKLEDLESTLLKRMEEYKVFKEMAVHLKDRREYYSRVHLRQSGDTSGNFKRPIKLEEVSLRDLLVAFSKVWEEVERRGEVAEIAAEPITVAERMLEIEKMLSSNEEGLEFTQIFTRRTKIEVIVTFLAVLELAKQTKIKIIQGQEFGSIVILPARSATRSVAGGPARNLSQMESDAGDPDLPTDQPPV